MIVSYIDTLLGTPANDLESALHLVLAIYLVIMLFKIPAGLIMRLIGIKERRSYL